MCEVFGSSGYIGTAYTPFGEVTATAYSEDGLTTTVTTPAGATTITTRHTDGSTASVSGTAQRAMVYVYDLNGSNERHTTKLADGTTIAQSITNGFGQTIAQEQLSHMDLQLPAYNKIIDLSIRAGDFPFRGYHDGFRWS